MRHAKENRPKTSSTQRVFNRVAIHTHTHACTATMLKCCRRDRARTPYTSYWSFPLWPTILCFRRISFKTWILLPFIVGIRFALYSTRRARLLTHTHAHMFAALCRLRFDSAFRLPSSVTWFFGFFMHLSGQSLRVRFDNNLILIVIRMQLAATIKQI